MYSAQDLMQFDQQQAADFLIESIKSKELRLKHPHKDIVTYCRQSKRYRKANVLFFSDEKQQNHWYLIQLYSLVDGYICEDNIVNPINAGEIPQLYKLISQQEFQFDSDTTNTQIDGLLFSQVRPYHYIYDQYINYFHLCEIDPDISQYCFAGTSCFYEQLPNGKTLNVASDNGCYLFPCTVGSQYDSQNAEKMHTFLRKNSPVQKTGTDFSLWFGITAQKRSWLEQVKGCVSITKQLLTHYDSITIIVDGWTSLSGGIADSPKDIARDMTVFDAIASQLAGMPKVTLINLIGKDYKEKISYANGIDYFIANSGTGGMVPMMIAKKQGVIHTNGRLHTFERSYNDSVRIVPNNKIIAQDAALDSGAYSTQWSVVYNLLLDIIGIDAKIPEAKLSTNNLFFDLKRFIFKKSIQIGTKWQKILIRLGLKKG